MDASKQGSSGGNVSRKTKDEGGKKRKSGDNETNPNEEYAEAALFFFEDEVYKLDRKKGRVKFGVVTDTYTDSYSGDEEDEDVDILNKGEVRITFYPEGKEIVQSENAVGLADRTLLPGDVVRRIVPGKKSTSGQSGYVREVNMKVDVKVLGTKFVITNIPCERLRSISAWNIDTAVCLGSWVGSTVNVEEKAILKCFNGGRVELGSRDFYRFSDLNTPGSRDELKTNIFYPGNVIYGRLPALDRIKNLTPEIALLTNKKGRPIVSKYTVESMSTDSVSIVWQCRALSQEDDPDSQKQPDECVQGEKLKQLQRMNNYESCMLQIQDRAFMKFTKCDKLIKFSEWEEEMLKKCEALHAQQNSSVGQNGETRSEKNRHSAAESTPNDTRSRLRKLISRSTSSQQAHPGTSVMQNRKSNSKLVNGTVKSLDSSVEEFFECECVEVPHENLSCDATSTISTPRGNPRHSKRRHVKKKMRNLKRSLTSPFMKKEVEPKEGDEMVVEILLVYSTITVVWQDGTIELGVPSTQLFPIHHLDNHEFFPGDYVCSSKEELKPSQRDYGIIQHVDHGGRTGVVKWFTTYVNMDKPFPTYNGQTELSVYDLKDHPDFQFRPGTMVIRVANFVGEDEFSTAGQIVDNYPDGRIKVWWVNGHITMCYPQDLFEVAQGEQDVEIGSDEESDASWETESEKSEFGSDDSTTSVDRQQHIMAGIDSAREAMKRLECIVKLSHDADKTEITKELLSVYKNCRFFDRLMHTNFFHEDNFPGILCIKDTPETNAEEEKPNEASTSTATSKASKCCNSTKSNSHLITLNLCGTENSAPNDFSPKVVINMNARAFQCGNIIVNALDATTPTPPNVDVATSPVNPNPIKRKSSNEMATRENQRRKTSDSNVTPMKNVSVGGSQCAGCGIKLTDNELIMKYKNEYFDILHTAKTNIAKAFEKHSSKHKTSQHDSGNYSRTENGDDSSMSCNSSNDLAHESDSNASLSSSNTQITIANPETIETFCILINDQMEKCKQMIDERYKKAKEVKKLHDEEQMETDIVADNESIEISSLEISEGIDVKEEAKSLNTTSEETLPASDASQQSVDPSKRPMTCSSPASKRLKMPADENCFEILSKAPTSHRFISTVITPSNKQLYQRAVQREYKLMKTSLPSGVKVRAYEDRMDLLSIMMEGPKNTPYEDALFFFDIQMVRDYPKSPPSCHYISYCIDRLNPNLYEEGKVCVSLLGTWTGRDTEVWSPGSTLLQLLVSIQGLILVDEPYYNEAGYEKQRGSQHGQENSQMYNEMTIIKVLQSTIKQIENPPEVFREELLEHFRKQGNNFHERIKSWVQISKEAQTLKVTKPELLPKELTDKCPLPPFPFLPCSRGCCLALESTLKQFKGTLDAIDMPEISNDQNAATTITVNDDAKDTDVVTPVAVTSLTVPLQDD